MKLSWKTQANVACAVSACALLVSMTAMGSPPPWTKDGSKRNGNKLVVTCDAMAPAKDLAYRLTLDSCKATATELINGDFQVHTLTVESEKSVVLHSEVSAAKQVQGLKCLPDHDYTEAEDQGFHTFIQCRFDLAGVHAVTLESPPVRAATDNQESIIQGQENAKSIDASKETISRKSILQSTSRHVLISCIPKCDDVLLVGGARSRAIAITSNPQAVLIYPDDRELIARKKSFLPKHVLLSKDRKPADDNYETESLELTLERP